MTPMSGFMDTAIATGETAGCGDVIYTVRENGRRDVWMDVSSDERVDGRMCERREAETKRRERMNGQREAAVVGGFSPWC